MGEHEQIMHLISIVLDLPFSFGKAFIPMKDGHIFILCLVVASIRSENHSIIVAIP